MVMGPDETFWDNLNRDRWAGTVIMRGLLPVVPQRGGEQTQGQHERSDGAVRAGQRLANPEQFGAVHLHGGMGVRYLLA